jgi:hypothetical protein
VTYSYTGGRLDAVAAESETTSYAYEGDNLTRVAAGETERTFGYDAGRVTSTVDGDRRDTWQIREADGNVEVVTPTESIRTYRFEDGVLLEVEDSELGLLLRRDVSGGRMVADTRPLDGVSTAFLDDGTVRVTEERADAPPRVADAGRWTAGVGSPAPRGLDGSHRDLL